MLLAPPLLLLAAVLAIALALLLSGCWFVALAVYWPLPIALAMRLAPTLIRTLAVALAALLAVSLIAPVAAHAIVITRASAVEAGSTIETWPSVEVGTTVARAAVEARAAVIRPPIRPPEARSAETEGAWHENPPSVRIDPETGAEGLADDPCLFDRDGASARRRIEGRKRGGSGIQHRGRGHEREDHNRIHRFHLSFSKMR